VTAPAALDWVRLLRTSANEAGVENSASLALKIPRMPLIAPGRNPAAPSARSSTEDSAPFRKGPLFFFLCFVVLATTRVAPLFDFECFVFERVWRVIVILGIIERGQSPRSKLADQSTDEQEHKQVLSSAAIHEPIHRLSTC